MNSAAKELGKLGGNATKDRHGSKHFSEAGKKGMAKRWGSKPIDNTTNQDVVSETSKDAPATGRKGDA